LLEAERRSAAVSNALLEIATMAATDPSVSAVAAHLAHVARSLTGSRAAAVVVPVDLASGRSRVLASTGDAAVRAIATAAVRAGFPRQNEVDLVDVANHLFLPCLTLTLAYLGEYYLLMRSSLLDVLGEEYVVLARAKGLREKHVLWQHAVPNALLPTVTLIALNFGFVLGGAITVETVFSYPGLGLLTFDALQSKDFALLQGMFLFFSLAVIIANFIADLLYVYLDPRVRVA